MHVLLIVTVVALGIPAVLCMSWLVHRCLERFCEKHAERFCRRHGLEIRRLRSQPECEQSGIKTESTLVQLDCLDEQGQRRLVLLSVWPLGVRRMISHEPYPDFYDNHWPKARV